MLVMLGTGCVTFNLNLLDSRAFPSTSMNQRAELLLIVTVAVALFHIGSQRFAAVRTPYAYFSVGGQA